MLALNILHRSFTGLVDQPMEYGQSSPIGYVFSVKVFTLLLGDSEYALRLYSLIVGCGALLLMALFSKRYLYKTGTLVSIALFAAGPHLVYYSAEVKQYIGDVAVSLIFMMIAFKLIDEQATFNRFLLFGGIGAILLWFAHPAVFSAAGVGATLLLHYGLSKDRKKLSWALLCGVMWGISLITFYLVHLRHLASSELLLGFWQEGFMPLPPWKHLDWLAQVWQSLLHDPLGTGVNPVFALIIFAFGIYFLFRRDWRLGAMICLPLVFALLASGLHKYSLIGRLLLFTTPIFILALGAGIDGLGLLFKQRYLSLGIQLIGALFLLYMPFQISYEEFITPRYREHIKPFMEYLRDHRKADDLIYVYYNAGPAFRFYAPKYGLDSNEYMIGADRSVNPQAPFDEIDTLVGHKRVWIIFSHVYERSGFNEKDFILERLDQAGKKEREYRVPETSVFLYLYNLK